jgi:hypothetical protein
MNIVCNGARQWDIPTSHAEVLAGWFGPVGSARRLGGWGRTVQHDGTGATVQARWFEAFVLIRKHSCEGRHPD